MNKQEKKILNKIYVNLESISWQTQTIEAREKWQEIKSMFDDLDIKLTQ